MVGVVKLHVEKMEWQRVIAMGSFFVYKYELADELK
jgi:hypothetical protein